MNPAEEIVKFWLQEKGYFVQSSVKIGRKEIDILAINQLNPKDRKHIEVSVSIRMVDTKETPQTKALHYKENKFEDPRVQEEIYKRFGDKTPYSKELVVGDIVLKGRNAVSEFTEECSLLSIKVIPFSLILNEIISGLGSGTQLNSVIKTVQLCNKFSNQRN